jgi:prephenate dehydrogenase
MLAARLAVIGVGLIGGSLASSLRFQRQCGEVVGCGRNLSNLQQAVRLGVIDRYTHSMAEAVENADLVLLAVPLGTMRTAFREIRHSLLPNAVITDVGSAKGSVVADARAELGSLFPQFVAGHPIAGAERSGVTAARADLFIRRKVILTPTAETNPFALQKIKHAWRVCGAEVIEMGVQHHDEVLAATSHLPHILAYTLVDLLAQMETKQEIFRYAAGGFRDFTRIASSDPQMWHDICLSNKEQILTMIEKYQEHLQILKQAIQSDNSNKIKEMLVNAKTSRDKFKG